MNFIQTGNNDKDGRKTFINLDRITLIDKHPKHYTLWEGFSGCSGKHEVSNMEVGYEKLKEILEDIGGNSNE